jgi:hypothetical protein
MHERGTSRQQRRWHSVAHNVASLAVTEGDKEEEVIGGPQQASHAADMGREQGR